MPDDQLPDAARLDDHWLAVALLGVGWERAPDLFTGQLVERHYLGVRLSAHDGDGAIAVDQRRAGDAPRRHLHAVIGDVILLPDHLAGAGIQAQQDAGCSHDVDTVAIHGGSGARSTRLNSSHIPLSRMPSSA